MILNINAVNGTATRKDTCKKLLTTAGCDDEGYLLEENVCINSTYQSEDAPNEPVTVHMKFLKWPIIQDISEGGSAIKLQLRFVHLWEDKRVNVNLQNLYSIVVPLNAITSLMNNKIHKTPGSNVEKFRLLPLKFRNFCNSIEQSHKIKIWTPFEGFFHIKQQLSMKSDIPDDPWGVKGRNLRLTVPLNESKPLISLVMEFFVTIECKFDYIGYPMNTESCELRFDSSELNPLNLKLFDPEGLCHKQEKAYERNGFYVTASCIIKPEQPSQIGFNLFVERVLTKYIFQYYLPSVMIVTISQTSFVIPLSALAGRIGLVVTQFLALTNIFINEQVNVTKNMARSESGMF